MSKHHRQKHGTPSQHNPTDAENLSDSMANGPVRVVIESTPPEPPPTEEEKSEKRKENRFRWGKAILEILAFLGLLAYVVETRRTNNLTEQAMKNAMEADRPWMGASVGVQNFESGKSPVYSVSFQNTGRRPAKVTLTAVHSRFYDTFPTEPEYNWDTTPSMSIIVPGQPVVSAWNGLLDDPEKANFGSSTFYIYGKIEYIDLRTGSLGWTHVCWRYIPKMRGVINGGFLNCTEYNDAK
jgi:hypothetical protein